MKLANMKSTNGNTVPNQFVINDGDGLWFQSYETMIAHKVFGDDCFYLDTDAWDYSKTTSRYRNLFTGLTTAQTKAGIKDGSIKLVDLN